MGSKRDEADGDLRRALERTEQEKRQLSEQHEVTLKHMEGLRGMLAGLLPPGTLPEDLSPDELRQELALRLASPPATAAGKPAVNGASGSDPQSALAQLLPPMGDRDEASTEKALRAVAGVLGQTGKVVGAALKQAKGRGDRLNEIVTGIEQVLVREVETAEDATTKIKTFFKDLHEALTTREEEILKEFAGIRTKEKQRVEDRLADLKTEANSLSAACGNVEALLDGSTSSSIGKLDAFNSPLEGLLEAMDSAAKVLEREGKGKPMGSEAMESLSFHLCSDSSLYRQIESLQITSFEQPHRDGRGRVVGKGSKVVLMGTPEAVAQEAREQALGVHQTNGIDYGGSGHESASHYGSVSARDVEVDGGRWDMLEDQTNGAQNTVSNLVGGLKLKVVTILPFNQPDTQDEEPKGLVYWLGTHGHQDDFRNPALLASNDPFLVVLRASSRIEGELASLTGRSHLRGTFFETDSALSSWVAIELPEGLYFRPDHYTMSYYVDGEEHIPRNWVLQGSADGVRWTTLRVHENDTMLEDEPHVATWALGGAGGGPAESAVAGAPRGVAAYRSFRVTQTGPTSSGTLFLILSSIELFGTLFSATGKVTA